MFYTIRWTDPQARDDKWVVVEAETRPAAEAWALKRGVPFVVLTEAKAQEIWAARDAGLLRNHTPRVRHKCWGEPVGRWQMAFLMLAGVTTAILNLRVPDVCPFF